MVVVVSCVWPASGVVFASYTFDATDALENLMVLLEAEHALPQEQQRLVCGTHAWTVQDATRRLVDVGLVDNDNDDSAHRVLVYRLDDAAAPATTLTAPAAPLHVDAAAAQARILQLFAQADSSHAAADTMSSSSSSSLPASVVSAQQQQPLPLPLLDMDDAEVQRRLYEEIQRRNIDESLAQALEHTPEAFASVTMLYIDCAINGVPVKAFVDSGAQVSLMNVATAERCDLMRLLDRRMRGVAKGVGTQTILGRIHMAVVRAGSVHLPCSFAVLEQQEMDVILGLDQLRRHRMCIDLRDNCLRIADAAVPFLGEADLPDYAKLHGGAVDDGDANAQKTHGEAVQGREGSADDAHASQQQPQQPQQTQQQQQQQHAAPLTDAEHEQVLQNFMAATAMRDRAAATAILEAFAWNADAALSAFLPS